MAHFDPGDAQWRSVAPRPPDTPRGVPRTDDRRVLNGIFLGLRTGSPWRDLPERHGPHESATWPDRRKAKVSPLARNLPDTATLTPSWRTCAHMSGLAKPRRPPPRRRSQIATHPSYSSSLRRIW